MENTQGLSLLEIVEKYLLSQIKSIQPQTTSGIKSSIGKLVGTFLISFALFISTWISINALLAVSLASILDGNMIYALLIVCGINIVLLSIFIVIFYKLKNNYVSKVNKYLKWNYYFLIIVWAAKEIYTRVKNHKNPE